MTVSFLPAFSLPYTHFSLVARSQAIRRRFVEKRSWEDTAPPLKDPNRIPAPSTLRRWGQSLDSSHSAFSVCAVQSKPWRTGWIRESRPARLAIECLWVPSAG